MTDQERDDLMERMVQRLERMDQRLERMEQNMVTQDGLESFMTTAFGQLLSDHRIQRGLESMHTAQRKAAAAG